MKNDRPARATECLCPSTPAGEGGGEGKNNETVRKEALGQSMNTKWQVLRRGMKTESAKRKLCIRTIGKLDETRNQDCKREGIEGAGAYMFENLKGPIAIGNPSAVAIDLVGFTQKGLTTQGNNSRHKSNHFNLLSHRM